MLLYGNTENGINEKCNMCNSILFFWNMWLEIELQSLIEKHGSRSNHLNQIGNSDNF